VIVCLRTVLVPSDWRARYLAWIATSDPDALTASDVHQAVTYAPITRYEVIAAISTCPGSPCMTVVATVNH
jgi:hypothetical protein